MASSNQERRSSTSLFGSYMEVTKSKGKSGIQDYASIDQVKEHASKLQYTTHYIAPKKLLGPEIAEKGIRSVGIIGGGVSGIVTARVLLDEGVDVSIFEQSDKLGGVWSENYAGFGIQVPSALYEFPDEPLSKGWDFAGGPMINSYIIQYAQKHGVDANVRFEAEVERIVPDGNGYYIHYSQNDKKEKERFDLVVVATGVYGKYDKFIPDWPGKDGFKGELLHASDYLDTSIAKNKQVITVGYGKSAFDCAQISCRLATSSTLLFRDCHWCVPRKILGLVPFEWATFSRFGAACLKPMYPTAGPFEKLIHAIPQILDGFWWLVAQIFAFQFGLKPQKEGDIDLVPNVGFIEDFWCGHGILPHPDFFPLIRNGSIKAVHGQIKEVKQNSVVLKSGEELPCDILVAATGYKPIRNYLPKAVIDLKESDGLWLYRNMIHPDHQNLVFLNSETTTFTNITTASVQARWLVELLAGTHKLPSNIEMFADIKKTKEWKTANMPKAGAARAYMIQTHQVHYYDQLLKDMGASIRRKSAGGGLLGVLREIFEPYRPADFNTIVTGEYKHLPEEQAVVGSSQSAFVYEFLMFLLIGALVYFHNKVFFAGLAALF